MMTAEAIQIAPPLPRSVIFGMMKSGKEQVMCSCIQFNILKSKFVMVFIELSSERVFLRILCSKCAVCLNVVGSFFHSICFLAYADARFYRKDKIGIGIVFLTLAVFVQDGIEVAALDRASAFRSEQVLIFKCVAIKCAFIYNVFADISDFSSEVHGAAEITHIMRHFTVSQQRGKRTFT